MNKTSAAPHQLVIIDNQISNYQSLVNDIGNDANVLILNSSSDGLTQISDYLTILSANVGKQGFVPLQSIHIISHGSTGSLLLGSSTVTVSNLSSYNKQLATIGNALTDTGDILLYGCNVAADQTGMQFINQFADLTNADVAASTDLTGNNLLGGNWLLEKETGAIQANILNANIEGVLDVRYVMFGDQGGSKSDVMFGGTEADKLYGKDLADNLSGGLGNDTLSGGYGDDILFGEDGDDNLWGEDGDDYLAGGNGNDILDGGLGSDTVIGGAGNDTYYLGYDAVDVIDDQGLSTDIDTVFMPYQLSSYTLPTGIENGTIANGTNASNLTGNDSDNALTGNDGNNKLSGGVGRDSLFGGKGNDVLIGGTSNDTLSGGVGKDTFTFNTALTANIDKITDFKVVDDTIQLDNTIFTKLTATGVLNVGLFVRGVAAQDSNDYIIYNLATGLLSYDADGNGAGSAVGIAILGVNLALTNADFIVGSSTPSVTTNHAPTGGTYIDDTTPTQGQTLSIFNNLADSDGLGSITYQWQAAGINIGTGNSYTVTTAEVGKAISVVASYTDGLGKVERVSSPVTSIVTTPVNSFALASDVSLVLEDSMATFTVTRIDSTAAETLNFNVAGNTNGGTVTAAAANDFSPVSGVVTFAAGEATATFTVNATADSKTEGLEALKVSLFSGNAVLGSRVILINDDPYINHVPSGSVYINDTTPTQGQILTASNTLADSDGLGSITYQWQAAGINIGTGNSYTVTTAEVGKSISVVASYTDGLGKVETVSSPVTSIVTTPVITNHLPTGDVIINDTTPEQNQTLSVTNTLYDADGLGAITYTWLANGLTVGISNTHTVTSNEVGKALQVTASYTDNFGHAETVSSTPTAVVVNSGGTVDPTSGTPGYRFTPQNGTVTGEDGTSVNYAVSLNTQPLRDVTLSFTSSNEKEGVINSAKTMTFTNSNWSTAQTLTIAGVDDFVNDGNMSYQVTIAVSTIDANYKLLTTIAPLALTNSDNDLTVPGKVIYGDAGGSKVDIITSGSADNQSGDGADTIYGKDMPDDLSGGLGNDTIYGGLGPDNLFGEDGNDELWGDQDADYLDGGAGNDRLEGGTGSDTMIGGAGNDTYYLSYDTNDFIDDRGLETDVDTVIQPYDIKDYTLPKGIENGTMATGSGASNLTGNEDDNTLTGNDGANMLVGAVGRDSLFGGVGDDVLSGGTGNDILEGGEGKDTFIFNTALATDSDTINNFSVVDDKIQLDHAIFTKLTPTGELNDSLFFRGAAAHDANDYVIYNPTTGVVSYDANGNGAGAGVKIAMVGVNLTLTAADFVIV